MHGHSLEKGSRLGVFGGCEQLRSQGLTAMKWQKLAFYRGIGAVYVWMSMEMYSWASVGEVPGYDDYGALRAA